MVKTLVATSIVHETARHIHLYQEVHMSNHNRVHRVLTSWYVEDTEFPHDPYRYQQVP